MTLYLCTFAWLKQKSQVQCGLNGQDKSPPRGINEQLHLYKSFLKRTCSICSINLVYCDHLSCKSSFAFKLQCTSSQSNWSEYLY